ncbi:MAG: NAD(P)H-dependent oxidoreductase [Cyclobacteriaceae bacterium]
MSYIIVCGTNRKNSVSKIISGIYQNLLQEHGITAEVIDLAELPADFTQSALYENAGKNDDFNVYRGKMLEAQKYVFIVPEYNGSFPGVLKAFIDGLQFPNTFPDKKCALVGLSSGVQGAGLALSHLTDIFNYCGMNVMALKPKLARIEENMTAEEIDNALYKKLLEQQVEKLIRF